jgi:hypothetical protein
MVMRCLAFLVLITCATSAHAGVVVQATATAEIVHAIGISTRQNADTTAAISLIAQPDISLWINGQQNPDQKALIKTNPSTSIIIDLP